MRDSMNIVSGLRRSCMSKDTEKFELQKSLKSRFIDTCPQWRVCLTSSRFNRRITALEWHPMYTNMITYASHGGDVLLLDTNTGKERAFIEGEGFGYGCITDLAYDHSDPMSIYCSSINGTLTKRDFEGKQSVVLLDTMDIMFWWTTVVYSHSRKMLFTGGNTGRAVIMDRDGTKIKEYHKFHKGKIHHSNLSPINDNIIVTSSNDRTVALWDLRYLTDDPQSCRLAVMQHNAPVNSAYFDPWLGSRVLTTSQNSELRLYESHDLWAEPSLIVQHPHRHFQHMTNIKATWHPLYNDLCVIGRYPASEDVDQSRCVDIIDLNDKEGPRNHVTGQFMDPSVSQIMVVNKFNSSGDTLATGMGYTGVLWRYNSDYIPALSISEDVRKKMSINGRYSNGRITGQRRSNDNNGGNKRKRNDKRKTQVDEQQQQTKRRKRNI